MPGAAAPGKLPGKLFPPPSYIRVRAVAWECGEGDTHAHRDRRGQYTFRLGYASREMTRVITVECFVRKINEIANRYGRTPRSGTCSLL